MEDKEDEMQSKSKYRVKEEDRREGARKIVLQGKKVCGICNFHIRGSRADHEAGTHHQSRRNRYDGQ